MDIDPETAKQNEFIEDLYYYALVMLKSTVVAIFKNNSEITVTPTDINLLQKYCQLKLDSDVKGKTDADDEFYRYVCLPGMTEDF